MAIADIATSARSASAERPWRTCQVCHALDDLPDVESEALRELLAGKMRYSDIEAELAADSEAPNLHRDALSRHARGRCDAKDRLR